MTVNKGFKMRVRARAARTGESYTAALQHLQEGPRPLRIAVGQLPSRMDPTDLVAIGTAGEDIRSLMRQAHQDGARLIHLGEGALCWPDKRLMSSDCSRVAAADWSRFDWDGQARELQKVAQLAAELKLWTVLGVAHRAKEQPRPYNSLSVIDHRGSLAKRYDERMLSATRAAHMYTAGTRPLTFDVGGVRFGCLLGMESVYPELFVDYERRDVDCVLLSSHGPNSSFALQAQGHASTNRFWVSYATSSGHQPGGIAGLDGTWNARCPATDEPSIAITDVGGGRADPARSWRRQARRQV